METIASSERTTASLYPPYRGQEKNAASLRAYLSPNPDTLIPILQLVNNLEGCSLPEAARKIAVYLRISRRRIFGVASFDAKFYLSWSGQVQYRIQTLGGDPWNLLCRHQGPDALEPGAARPISKLASGTNKSDL